MSTAPASSHAGTAGTAGAGHAAGARAAHAAARKPGAHGSGTDHFSMLLSLLSASDATGLPALLGTDGSATPSATDALGTGATDPNAAAADGSHLAAVMQWMGLPQGGAQRGATDADTETGLEATGGRGGKGHGLAGALSGQTGADSARPTGQGEPLPAGMQRLAQSEAPDSATLAALAGSTEGVAAETATPDQVAAAGLANPTSATTAPSHPGASPRLSAHAPAGAHAQANPVASTQALQQSPVSVQIERLQTRGDHTTIASTRSTVTLDERFSASTPSGDALGAGAASSAAATAPASTGAGASGGDLAGQTGHGGQDTGAATSSSGDNSGSGSQSGNPDDGALWAAEERAQNEERLDAFTAPTLHEAKLRVGDEGSDAIDIRLSLSGQELDLGFRTDSAEARAALVDHAQGSLGELLQRSGIQLGDVSVGAQNGQGGGSDARHSAGRSSPAGRVERSGPAVSEAPITPLRPRTDGNRPLDTFA